MEIFCPSCHAQYNTENYKDEFEISCSQCGYSILIPDESALHEEEEAKSDPAAEVEAQALEAPPHFSAEPATLDAQDDALLIPGSELNPKISEDVASIETPITPNLTPSEQLPEGMPYDPFEVQSLGLSANTNNQKTEEKEETLETPLKAPEQASPAETREAPKAQVLIEKSVRSSLGQFLGLSYRLKFSALSENQLNLLKTQALAFCQARPWLEDELKKRHLVLTELTSDEWFSNLPEPIAVELYIRIMEYGGKCEFHLETEKCLAPNG